MGGTATAATYMPAPAVVTDDREGTQDYIARLAERCRLVVQH